MTVEGQELKPTLNWLRRQLALMDGCCLDSPEDVERVAQHLFGNWVMVEQGVTLELAAALEVAGDWFRDREGYGYEDRVWPVVKATLARYEEGRTP